MKCFISAFDISARIWKALVNSVQDAGGSDEDLRRLETDLGLREKVAKLIVGEQSPRRLPTWRTIQLGTHKDAASLKKAIQAKKNRVSEWGADILKRIGVSQREESLDLIKLSVKKLGFSEGATREKIYAKAKELGLDLCPPEVGPQLRLQYQDQPYGEWLLIGMEPIADSDGLPDVFSVGRDVGDRWLFAHYGDAADFWDPESVWGFVRRK